MSDGTAIQWTDASWNPLRAHAPGGAIQKTGWACVRVSQGCVNCYAAGINKRLGTGLDYTMPALAKVTPFLDEKALRAPLKWRKPRRIFVCSMTDLFGEWVSDAEIEAVRRVMASTPQHTYQVLTKRPERMRRFMETHDILPNVWLGVSVEDQRAADERIPHLLATPAAVRFLSCEPLLGPVTLDGHAGTEHEVPAKDYIQNGIDWVIVGGESGPRARPMNLAWARDIVSQCRSSFVAPFVKQLGRRPYEMSVASLDGNVPWNTEDSHGGDPSEWPEDLIVREWPRPIVVSA